MSPFSREEVRAFASTLTEIKQVFSRENEDFDDKELNQLTGAPPARPDFPFLIFLVAIFKDVLDIPGDLSVVGIIFTTAASLVLSMILTLWCLFRLSGGWWKKRMIRWLWTGLFITFVVEILPFIKIIPTNTIFILMAHFKEKKIVRLFDSALEVIHRKGTGHLFK